MKKLYFFLFVISLTILSGCSKQPEEMSTVRSNLILDIFKLIKQNRHEEAYIKVKKLRDLDPTNSYLPLLEEVEKGNGERQKINTLLKDRKKQEEATRFLKSVIEHQSYVEDKSYNKATEKLKDLFRLDELSDIIISPQPVFPKNQKFIPASQALDNAIEEFVLITQKWNISAQLRNKVIRQKKTVAKLRKEESLRAVQSLELLAPGLSEREYQTMMAMSFHAADPGTK